MLIKSDLDAVYRERLTFDELDQVFSGYDQNLAGLCFELPTFTSCTSGMDEEPRHVLVLADLAEFTHMGGVNGGAVPFGLDEVRLTTDPGPTVNSSVAGIGLVSFDAMSLTVGVS